MFNLRLLFNKLTCIFHNCIWILNFWVKIGVKFGANGLESVVIEHVTGFRNQLSFSDGNGIDLETNPKPTQISKKKCAPNLKQPHQNPKWPNRLSKSYPIDPGPGPTPSITRNLNNYYRGNYIFKMHKLIWNEKLLIRAIYFCKTIWKILINKKLKKKTIFFIVSIRSSILAERKNVEKIFLSTSLLYKNSSNFFTKMDSSHQELLISPKFVHFELIVLPIITKKESRK